jgi:hypothetical protein
MLTLYSKYESLVSVSHSCPLSGGEHGPWASKSSIKYDQRYLRRRFGARDRTCSGGHWGIHTFDSQHKLGQSYVEPTHGKKRWVCVGAVGVHTRTGVQALMHACGCVCRHACMHACMHIYACIYAFTCVCMYACKVGWMACIYV